MIRAAVAFAATVVFVCPAHGVERRVVNDGHVVLEGVPPVPEHVVEDLRRYQSIRSASFADWAPDGGLYVKTRFADTVQLHRVDRPGGARHQLTFYGEPVGAVARRPGHDALAFTMDVGGSERAQIYLWDPASAGATRVSDGESRHGSLVWSGDGSTLAFQSNRRDGRANDVWVRDADGRSSLALEAPDGAWWAPADFSPDGQRLLVTQYVSANDSSAWVVDLARGRERRLAGDGTSINMAAAFDATGDGVFLVTDRGAEFARLAWMPVKRGAMEVITTDIAWNVEDVVLSDDRTRGAFTVNEGGLSRVYLFDPASRRYAPVEGVPVGVVYGLSFDPDGHRLALTLSGSSGPGDVYTLELGEGPLEHGALSRWTFSEVGGLDTAAFATPQAVRYPTFDGREIPAFVYRPTGEGPHPVVISIHGGPEGQFRPSFSSRIQLLVDTLGVAVIAPNVRGSRGYGKQYLLLDNGVLREDSVRDIGALLDWIAEQPDLDADRVAVMGGSYGGYMVLASAVHFGDRLKAAVDRVGISNFVTFLENTEDYRRDLRRVEYGDERDPEMRAHLEAISPSNHAGEIDVPLLVIQGLNDPRVPASESDQIVAAVRRTGTPVWYVLADNEGHGFKKKENADLAGQVMALFLATHLLEP